jgi:two-component system sensor histidine kinase PilS (NtrC family)
MRPFHKTFIPDIDEIAHRQNQKVFDVYNIYRVVLSLVLLTGFYFSPLTFYLGTIDQELFLPVILAYTTLNILALFRGLLPRNITVEVAQYIVVILVDIIFLVLISYSCGSVSSGMANLLVVPVASGSLLFRTRMSTFFAAVGSILAIYSEVYLYLVVDDGIVYFVQAGLLGFTLFAVSGLIQYLGGRIRTNELITRQQTENIQSLQEMNDQIIRRMHNGILVVDRYGNILNINEAATRFLQFDASQEQANHLPPELFEQLRTWQEDNNFKPAPFRLENSPRDLRAGFSYLKPGNSSERNILIFLEDYSLLTSHAQQLKLMSLGRLTASIAHEVRNPLGAISHATQLLNESEKIDISDKRLLEIISSHSNRVNRIIESILDLSRNKTESQEQFVLRDWMASFINKLTNSRSDEVEIEWDIEPHDITIQFNQGQLEQVLTNLIENGLRYSHKTTGRATIHIEVTINEQDGKPVMHIMDSGKGIAEELVQQIFEPFFTTEQTGTGLGLFICKEICDANYAGLMYLPDYKNKSTFRINFINPDIKQPAR